MVRTLLGASCALALAGSAFAQVQINEMLIDGPGTDNGQEFIELSGAPNTSLTGLTLLMIEGDGANAGAIDVALSLTGFSTGSNGLFLWRDAAGTATGEGMNESAPFLGTLGHVRGGLGDWNHDGWGEPTDLTADDLLPPPGAGEDRDESPAAARLRECQDAVRAELAGGPLPSAELMGLLGAAGFGPAPGVSLRSRWNTSKNLSA